MSKHLKTFIVALLTVCTAVCLGIFAAACNHDKPDDGDDFPTSVSITIKLPDNTPAQGIWVQLCVVAADNTLGACLEPVETNAQGVATVSNGIDKANGKMYEVHLTGVPTEYQYVDASGTPYEKGKGAHVDITNPSSLTITLKAAPLPDPEITLKAGNNSIELTKNAPIDVTINLSATDANASGYYRITATDMFNLSGTGLNVANTNDVVLHLTNGDKLSLSLADDAGIDYPYSLNIGLIALADGSLQTPLTADVGSMFVLNLEANQKVYISNDAFSPLSGHVALDVDGTNFKASYKHVDYTEKFTLDAPVYEEETLVEEIFSVGTTDGKAGVVTLKFTEHVDVGNSGTEDNPYIAELNVALNIECDGANDSWAKFTATEAGTYTIAYSADAYIADGGTGKFESQGSGSSGSFEVKLNANEDLNLAISTYSWSAGTVTITITKKA